MPSACAKIEKQNSLESQEPLKQVQSLVEKKIRNLEKRKGKLEILQQEQESGKALHDDQKKAVKKFDDVIEMLDFFKEFSKNVVSVFQDHSKVMRKQAKKEQSDRQQQETERLKTILLFQDILNGMGVSEARTDFLKGRNGAIQLTKEKLQQLDELYKLVFPDRTIEGEVFQKQLDDCSDRILALVDGKSREAFKGTSFKDLKDILTSIDACGYFEPEKGKKTDKVVTPPKVGDVKKSPVACERVAEKVEAPPQFVPANENQSVPISGASMDQHVGVAPYQPPQSEGYNFLQESRIESMDGGAPHLDPAVVAMAPIHGSAYGATPYGMQNAEVLASQMATGIPMTSASDKNAATYNSATSHQPIPTQTFTNPNFAAIPAFVPAAAPMALGMPLQQMSPHHTPNQDVITVQDQSQQPKVDQSNQLLSQQIQQQQMQQGYQDHGFNEYHTENRNIQGVSSQDKTTYYHHENGAGARGGQGYRGGYRRGRGRGDQLNGYSRGGQGGARGGNRGGYQGNNYNSNYGTNGQNYDKRDGVTGAGNLGNHYTGRGSGNRGRGAPGRNASPAATVGGGYGNKQ